MLESRIREIEEKIKNWKCRASATSKIMTSPNATKLPVGAMSYVEEEVNQMVYNYENEIENKQLEKGNICENENIELYNRLNFTDYKKADLPKSNDYLQTKSCDIMDENNDLILDAKSSWSKKTFPKTKRQAEASAKKSGYDWQMYSLMSIFKKGRTKVFYGFIETPEHLCEYETQSLHMVNGVPEELLQTSVTFQFDEQKEKQMFNRVINCRKYMLEYFHEILTDHGIKF